LTSVYCNYTMQSMYQKRINKFHWMFNIHIFMTWMWKPMVQKQKMTSKITFILKFLFCHVVEYQEEITCIFEWIVMIYTLNSWFPIYCFWGLRPLQVKFQFKDDLSRCSTSRGCSKDMGYCIYIHICFCMYLYTPTHVLDGV